MLTLTLGLGGAGHKFVKRAIEIEEIEAKRKKQPYLIVIDSREYDLGYYLLAIIVSTIAFYGVLHLSIPLVNSFVAVKILMA